MPSSKLLCVIIKNVMKSVLEATQRVALFFAGHHSFCYNHKMFVSNEGELRRRGVHTLMHTQRKSLRGVTIINEASIKCTLWNMGLLFPSCVFMTERASAESWHQRRHDWRCVIILLTLAERRKHSIGIEPVNWSFILCAFKGLQGVDMPIIFLITVVCFCVHMCGESCSFIPLFSPPSSVSYWPNTWNESVIKVASWWNIDLLSCQNCDVCFESSSRLIWSSSYQIVYVFKRNRRVSFAWWKKSFSLHISQLEQRKFFWQMLNLKLTNES